MIWWILAGVAALMLALIVLGLKTEIRQASSPYRCGRCGSIMQLEEVGLDGPADELVCSLCRRIAAGPKGRLQCSRCGAEFACGPAFAAIMHASGEPATCDRCRTEPSDSDAESSSVRSSEEVEPSTQGGPSRSAALALLGVDETASMGEIRSAFQKMTLLFHPDHVPAGATEARQVAEDRFKHICSAFETLLRMSK